MPEASDTRSHQNASFQVDGAQHDVRAPLSPVSRRTRPQTPPPMMTASGANKGKNVDT